MLGAALSLASSVAFIWGILEVFTEFHRAPGAGIPAAVRRAAARYGF